MKPILVDTSVWIDALNGRKTWQAQLLGQLIDDDAHIVLCPVIVQEILQGIKEDKHFAEVKNMLSGFEVLAIDPLEAAYGAASLYRNMHKHGLTIRKSNNCLIGFYAISNKAILLHNDDDFTKMAQHAPLKTMKQT